MYISLGSNHSFVLTDVNGSQMYAYCSTIPKALSPEALQLIRVQHGFIMSDQSSSSSPEAKKPLPTEAWGQMALCVLSQRPLHTAMVAYLTHFTHDKFNKGLQIDTECCAEVYDELTSWHEQMVALSLSLTLSLSHSLSLFLSVR